MQIQLWSGFLSIICIHRSSTKKSVLSLFGFLPSLENVCVDDVTDRLDPAPSVGGPASIKGLHFLSTPERFHRIQKSNVTMKQKTHIY